ncbi:MAG: ribonuclease G [Comamonas sp.]
MQQDILVNWSPQETRVALVENGAVQEIHVERALERGIVGNIYLGKVVRVLPGMQSAFIDIGLERAAFLHVADVWQRQGDGTHMSLSRHLQNKGEAPPPPPIEKQVFAGQSLMVQVIKEPIGTKGARLSTQISLAGRLLVFLPQDDHIGVSQKIPTAQRDELRRRLQTLAAEHSAPPGSAKTAGQGGFILRTNAEEASDTELGEDMRYLRKAWQRVRQAALTLPATSLLYQDLSLLQRILRDLVGEETQSIRIDSREQYGLLKAFGEEFMPMAVGKLQLYRGERPIFDLYRVDEEIVKALGRRVDLKSGGYLIIDQTEALTTVDVNTGGYVGARNFDETLFKTNLEAAHAIARQLRMRNLGGIVIIDFIDMAREEHRAAVLAELDKQLRQDRVKTVVGGFSPLGLVEMTRKRTRDSLAHMLSETCPVCQGRGHVKTPRSVAYDILREILREARQFNPREFRVIASPKVAELFLDEESQHLASLSEFIGKPISLQSETAMSQEQYDIVLM